MSRKFRTILFLPTLAVLAWPEPALANAGTPLLWANMFHLLFGNALIGWLEGWLLSRFFGAPRRLSILLMVAANYVSMTAGLFAFPSLVNRVGIPLLTDEPLYHVGALLVACIVAAFVASLIVEWPFCFAALRGGPRPFARSWKASAVVQTVSYALLVPLYALDSPVSLWAEVQLDRTLTFAASGSTWVYFISPRDGDVYRIRPNGTARELVTASEVVEPDAVLMLRPIPDDARWDLWVTSPQEGFDERRLVQGLPIRATDTFRDLYEQRVASQASAGSRRLGLDLRPIPPHERTLQLWPSPFHGGSLRIIGIGGGGSISIGVHTPLLNWAVRNATLVSDRLTIFQLEDQVVALDPMARKMGLLTLGRGPLVVLEAAEHAQAR